MPPPSGYHNFETLCHFVGASPNTVRSVVEHLHIEPNRPGGSVSLYTQADAVRVKAHYEKFGGYYKPVRKRDSHGVTLD